MKTLDKARHLISKMMNEENDHHAKLLQDLNRTINTQKYGVDILYELNLVHDTKIKLLEEIFDRLKDI